MGVTAAMTPEIRFEKCLERPVLEDIVLEALQHRAGTKLERMDIPENMQKRRGNNVFTCVIVFPQLSTMRKDIRAWRTGFRDSLLHNADYSPAL
jgi:hypothetical protein